MKKNTLLATAALAGMIFVGQGAMAQQDANRQSSTGDSSSSATSSQDRQKSEQSSSQNQSDQSSQRDSATTAGARGQQGSSARGQSSQNMDQKFVEFASTNDQFEIQASQLAEQQAQDDQIKQMAKQIRQDHEQSSKQLQQVAQQAGVQVSQQLKPHQQAMLQELKQMQGEEFDKAWLYGNVAGHVKAVLKFRDASRQAQNPQLKQFAMQTLPKLQQHLRHAEQLAQWDEASAETAGARERATSGSGTGSLDRSSSDRTGSNSATGAGSSSGSSSNTTGGQKDTGSGASSDSASGGKNPSR
jgi:putative membrane protein